MTVSFTFDQAATVTGGVLRGETSGQFVGVSIDSRQVQQGQAFVAIAGERFDGHRYCAQAAQVGAELLVVQSVQDCPAPQLIVDDTRRALGQLAYAWRLEVDPQVVGITGSVGKTTTKELTRNILELVARTHCTPGNFNNDIGLPLTLLSMDPRSRYLVAEMGMNAAGEIEALARLARPDVGLITCVAPVHLEGLGSIEAVAAAKAELLEQLGQGQAVVPDDQPLLDPWTERIPGGRCWRFGSQQGSRVRILEQRSRGLDGSRVRLWLDGQTVEFLLPLVGSFNVSNAAAAAAAALALEIDAETIARALARKPKLEHRSVVRSMGSWTVLDDCYNASPVSMKAALQTLSELAAGGQAVAVLGDMLELGPGGPQLHREVGAYAAGLGLELLVTVGQLGQQIARGAVDAGLEPQRVVAVEQTGAAVDAVLSQLEPGAHLLVKASRGARLEGVIDGLSQAVDGAGEGRKGD